MKIRFAAALLFLLIIFYSSGTAQNFSEREAIISVDRIWDRGQHNAFTSLINFDGKLFVAFREGAGHVSYINGTIRVLSSEDGQNWISEAHLNLEGVDLRDAQLSISPDNRIMLNMGGSVYYGDERISMSPVVSFSDMNGSNFSDPEYVELDPDIKSEDDWLWKVTWHKNKAYGTVYQVKDNGTALHLVESKNGLNYDFITTIDVPGDPNETALVFDKKDRMIAAIRRGGGNSHGYIGISEYPYKKWKLNELSVKLGGPNIITLPNEKLILGTREYSLDLGRKMILCSVTKNGQFKKLLTLPSGGDCSYPGMVVKDNFLYVSYYSSHEEKTAVYLASLRLNKILQLTEKQIAPEPYISKEKLGEIELKSDLQGSFIIYTLDGSVPSIQNGRKYDEPIKIKGTKLIRAVTFSENYLESSVYESIVGKDLYEESVQIDREYEHGLIYKFVHGEFNKVDEMKDKPIAETGISKNVTNALFRRTKNYGYQFSGFIKIPEKGFYTFILESNDGSVLRLNNKIIINNDGPHGREEKKGYISLKKGLHEISIDYFQLGGGAYLKLFWESDAFNKEEVPAAVFFH